MTNYPSWQYDEMQQVGKDYGSVAEVEAYDARHGKFRDVEKENESILKSIRLRPEHIVIEFGPGTGAFALQAARRCAKVYAVDISRAMLEHAGMKAERDGLTNIVFCHAGFLSYVHTGLPADVIVSNMAFHHLPDLWKGIALERMSGMLRYGGGLYLSDVIFEQENVRENIGIHRQARYDRRPGNAGGCRGACAAGVFHIRLDHGRPFCKGGLQYCQQGDEGWGHRPVLVQERRMLSEERADRPVLPLQRERVDHGERTTAADDRDPQRNV